MKNVEVGNVFETKEGCFCTVIGYKNSSNVLISFNDAHKHKMWVATSSLKSGRVKNPYHATIYNRGFYGAGKYKACSENGNTLEYSIWMNMFVRCYDDKRIVHQPTYENCEVCEEWFNFQVFAEWLNTNSYHGMGYALDKDILVRGNKIYSPDTCVLVPRQINSAVIIRKPTSNGFPVGVRANRTSDLFDAHISKNGKNKKIGSFESIELARSAYIKEKEIYVREMALVFRDRISDRAFRALSQWKHD